MADRAQMLKQIEEISFTVNDLTLYLDTHPVDVDALEAFAQAKEQRKQLLQNYAEQYEPLTIDCVRPGQHFAWQDGPMPWEGCDC